MNPNRRPDRRFWRVLAALAGLLLLWAVVTCLLLLSTLASAVVARRTVNKPVVDALAHT